MNIETIEDGFKVLVEEAGGWLRPSEPQLFRAETPLGIHTGLPPILWPRQLEIDSPRICPTIFSWSRAVSRKFTDSEYLAFPRLAPGHHLVQHAIQQGLAEVAGDGIREYGGTRRRVERRPERIIAGPEGTLPLLLLAAPAFLTPPPANAPGVSELEKTARDAVQGIALHALNYDRRIPCDEPQLADVVFAVDKSLAMALHAAGVMYRVEKGEDSVIFHISDPHGMCFVWAPPTQEMIVLPRNGTRNPHESVSLFPSSEIAEARISVAHEHPHGNPRARPVFVRIGVVDGDGRWLDVSHTQIINAAGLPYDHRTGMVNHHQNRAVIPGADGWYGRAYNEADEPDGIPSAFPADDGDRAYSTLFRMIAELLNDVYVREYKHEASAPAVEPLAEAIRLDTERLIHIITHSGRVPYYKSVEALQQIIIETLNQPNALAAIARVLGLYRIVPRAEPLWEALARQPLVGDEGEVLTDGYLSAGVRLPEIQANRRAGTHTLGEPTGIHRILDYARRVAGIRIPDHLSPLGKLAWLYTPIP